MDDQMFIKINNNMTFLLDTKNKILMFAFTTTLAMFGAALKIESSSVDMYTYTLPFFLLVPFTARITYYRIWKCHQSAYLRVFAHDRYMQACEHEIPIEKNFIDKLLGLFVNCEMLFLSIGCSMIYYAKNFRYIECSLECIILLFIPIAATSLVAVFCFSAYNYSKMYSTYYNKWYRVWIEHSEKK